MKKGVGVKDILRTVSNFLVFFDLVEYRKYQSPIMSMSKIIKMAAALVSMLSLETAMFSQFGGDMLPENQRVMIMATGAGIAVVIVAMSVYMIACTTKEIREIRSLN